jgi:hypothetical protein
MINADHQLGRNLSPNSAHIHTQEESTSNLLPASCLRNGCYFPALPPSKVLRSVSNAHSW